MLARNDLEHERGAAAAGAVPYYAYGIGVAHAGVRRVRVFREPAAATPTLSAAARPASVA